VEATDYLTGIATASPADTAESRAEKQVRIEKTLLLVQELTGRGELDEAIRSLEDAVMLDPKHRQVLFLLTQCLHTRSQVLEKTDPRRAFGMARQAAGYLKMLRDAHADFTVDERRLFADVLFDEARAYARANRQEDFSAALSAALDAGFDDVSRLRSEPDFELMRKDPRMAAVLQAADLHIESQASH
jgi:hypothetical protein